MSIHYKFKSALEYDTITFDGLHISVKDLKNSILQQKRIGKNSDFDLQVTNAQTKEVYADEDSLIPKNTSLLIARVPLSVPNKGKNWEGYGGLETGASARLDDGGPIGKQADLSSLDASEDDKIRAMISQSTQEYDPSNYMKVRGSNQVGPVPPNYKCYKCHLGGHWIKDCPLGLSTESVDIKKSTGIPKSFMRQVAGPDVAGAMITPNGSYAVHCNTVDTNAQVGGAHSADGGGSNPPIGPTFTTRADIPEDLLCSICDDLLVDAVMIPCCGNSFCDECVRNSLLESEEHECPDCHERDIAPTTLIPNRFLRKSVATFKNESGYIKKFREPRVIVPKKVEEARPIPADSSNTNNATSDNSGKTIISEADSTESAAKLAATNNNDALKTECKEEPHKPKEEEKPPSKPTSVNNKKNENPPSDIRPITNVANTYRENRQQHARDRERSDNTGTRYRVATGPHPTTGSYQRAERSPPRVKYRRSPQRGGLVREERSDTPTIDEPGLSGLGPAPDPHRDYAPPPGTFMNPEVRPPPQQQQQQQQQMPAPGQMMIQQQGPPQMQLPPPGMSVPPPGPYGNMPPQHQFVPGMPPNFRHPPPGAPPPMQQVPYMPGPYNIPPRPMFDGSRGPPPMIHPPLGSGYPPTFAPRGRPGLPPRGVRIRTPPNVIDDPLEAFNRILREKDERRRRQALQQQQRRSYSRSRSSSRSYSRSPQNNRRGGTRSPVRRRGASRSRSRSLDRRSPRSFSLSRSRSRSRSRSLSPFRDRDYSPPPSFHHREHRDHRDHYQSHHNSPPPPQSKYAGPPSSHYGGRGGRSRGGSRYRSPTSLAITGRNASPPPPSRGYNHRGGFKDFKSGASDRDRHYDQGSTYAPAQRDRDRDPPPTMAEMALATGDRYRNRDHRDYSGSGPTTSASTRDLRDSLRDMRGERDNRDRQSSPAMTQQPPRRFSPGSGSKGLLDTPLQPLMADRRPKSRERDVSAPSSSRQENRDRGRDRDRKERDRDRDRERPQDVAAGFYPPPAAIQGVVLPVGMVPPGPAMDFNRFPPRQQYQPPPGTVDQPLPPGEEPPPQQTIPIPPPQQQYSLYDPNVQQQQTFIPNQPPFIQHQHPIPTHIAHAPQEYLNRDSDRSRYDRSNRDRTPPSNRDKTKTSSKDNYDSPDRRKRRRDADGSPASKSRKDRDYSDDDKKSRKADKKKKKDKKDSDKKKKKDRKDSDKKDKKKGKDKTEASDKEDQKNDDNKEEQIIVEIPVVVKEPPEVPPVKPTVEVEVPQQVQEHADNNIEPIEVVKKPPTDDLYGDLLNEVLVDANIVQSYGLYKDNEQAAPLTNKVDESFMLAKTPERTRDCQAEGAIYVVEDARDNDTQKDLELDVLELHSQDDVEVDKALMHLLPEKSKWETETLDEQNVVVDTKQEDKVGTKVSSEVLKRAENAIFAKAINAIRPPIEIKKISLDRAKLYSNERTAKIVEDDFKVTLKNDHYQEEQKKQQPDVIIVHERAVEAAVAEQKPPPQRLSVKERLGCKVDDLDRIIRVDVDRNRSRSISPLSKKYMEIQHSNKSHRRIDLTRRERYNSRDKDRHARSYRNAERSRSKDRRKIVAAAAAAAREKSSDRAKKRRSRSRSRDKKKDSKRVKKDKDKPEKSTKTFKEDKHEPPRKITQEQPRQRSAEPAPPGTEDSPPPQKKPPQRKTTIDEATFEPDYDLESDDLDDKPKRSTTPLPTPVQQQLQIKTAVVAAVAAVAAVNKKNDTSSDSSDSSVGGKVKKKKHKGSKKSKKRRRKDSTSSSDDSSSDSDEDKERKRKKHRKKGGKKSKKRKHKDR